MVVRRPRATSRDEMLAAVADDAEPKKNPLDRKKPESFNMERKEMLKRLEASQPKLVPTSVIFLASILLCFGVYLYNGLIVAKNVPITNRSG